MTVLVTKPTVNIREDFTSLRAKVLSSVAQEAFWFSGDVTTTTFALPRGWKPKFVYVGGALNRPGMGKDYTVSYDGFFYSLVFAVAPAAVDVGVICVQEV